MHLSDDNLDSAYCANFYMLRQSRFIAGKSLLFSIQFDVTKSKNDYIYFNRTQIVACNRRDDDLYQGSESIRNRNFLQVYREMR